MPIKLPFSLPFRLAAITVARWIFVSTSDWPLAPYLLAHEQKHVEQCMAWYRRAWVFGVVAWWACYLLILPIAWNPFRRRWETEAFTAEGKTKDEIANLLCRPPYWLRRIT